MNLENKNKYNSKINAKENRARKQKSNAVHTRKRRKNKVLRYLKTTELQETKQKRALKTY